MGIALKNVFAGISIAYLSPSSGNAIVIASSTSVVIALSWGGVQHSWSSANVLVPLILGLLGLAFWLLYEAKWATYPIVRLLIYDSDISANSVPYV